MEGMHKICPFLNLFFWTLYLMVLVGYRRIKHYLVLLVVMLVLFGLYAKFVGIKTVYQGRDKNSDDVQSVPGTPQELQHGGEKDIIHKNIIHEK